MKTTILLLLLTTTQCILKAQTVTTVTDGLFSDGLAVDGQGNVYGSDFGGDSVFKYEVDGTVTVFKSGFVSPNGIGFDLGGNVYICDHFANVIYKYDTAGVELASYNDVITPAGIKNIPGTNELLIVGYSSNRISVLNVDDNSITEVFSGGMLNGPAGIAFINGQTYIGNFNDRKILLWENGDLTEIAQLPAGGSQNNFLGFLTSFNGQLYATQLGEGKVYSIDPVSGSFSVFAGSVTGNNDGPIETATFNLPNGIMGDETNNRIYVSDAGSKNLRIIQDITLGLDLLSQDNLEVILAPNPSQDRVRLSSAVPISEVIIYDMSMKRMMEFKGNNITSFETNQLTAGSYWVKIITEHGTAGFKKLLIR